MAFNPNNWAVISESGVIPSYALQDSTVTGAPGLYSYQSGSETLANISVANYFASLANILRVNDLIYVVGSDDQALYTVSSVTADPPAVSITLFFEPGDVVGPTSSTNNALVRWDGTTGRLVKNGTILEDDSGNLTLVNSIANGAGLIGTPSYTFTGDLDTGMWHSAANTLDFSTNALRGFQVDASPAVAVDYLSAISAATGTIGLPLLQAKGTDTNIDVGILPKGTGGLSIRGATNAGSVKLWNQANTFFAAIQAGAMASSITWTWPIADGTNGQALTTNASGVLSFATVVGGMSWTDQTTTPVTLVKSNGYVVDNAGLVTLNVPATAAVGDTFAVVGKSASGWLVQMNTGQTAHLGSSVTSSAGSLASTNQYDCIELICVTANTVFVVRSSMGNITVA